MRTLPFIKIRSLILTLALVILAGGIGFRLGEQQNGGITPVVSKNQVVVNDKTPSTVTVDFSLFWDVWQKMFQYYIDAPTLDKQKMIWGAITGMVAAAGDPYTSFFPPQENTAFKQDIGGQFEGIGAQLDLKDGRIVVVTPLKNSPAEAAGIKAGDYILKVDDKDTVGWTLDQAVNTIRGPKGTQVALTVLHLNSRETVVISVTRNTILVPSVESWIKEVTEIPEIKSATQAAQIKDSHDRIAYMKLSRFGDHTTEDWNKAVAQIQTERKKSSIRGLVFDLRNNPGGYLDGAVFIAGEFIKSGTVVSQKNSDGTIQNLIVDRTGQLTDIPMVVLVNKGSASAAEIVSGALKDYKRAKLVGDTTFGKGSVQTPFDLTQGASVHITTGKWLLPNGDSISQKGITPDYLVPLETADASSDAQLARAIQLLLQ